MTKSPVHGFVNECIARDTAAGGLSRRIPVRLYGLYLSWRWLLGTYRFRQDFPCRSARWPHRSTHTPAAQTPDPNRTLGGRND